MKYRVLLLLFVCSISVFAQQNVLPQGNTKTDANGFTYTYFINDPADVRIYQLKNGMQVWMSVNKAIPRIQTAIAIKTGSAHDPADHTGLAHYLEHLMFKGTDKYGTSDYAKEKPYLDEITALFEKYDQTIDDGQRKIIYHRIDSLSGIAAQYAIPNEYDKMVNSIGAKSTNAFTSFDETVFVNDVPSNEEDKWLQIEAERFHYPVFRLFLPELEGMYEEKSHHIDSDPAKVDEALYAGLFRNHTYGTQTTIGTIHNLKNPSLVQIYKYFHTYYVPNNMAIIISGDFDPEQTIKLVNNYFGASQPGVVPVYTGQPEQLRTQPEVKNVIGPDAESVTIGFRFPGQNSDATTYLDLITELLNNSTAGLMNLNLVKQQKMLSSSCGTNELKDYSVFEMDGLPQQGQRLEECKDLLLSQLDSLKQGHFDGSLIAAAINNLKEQRIISFENNAGRVFAMLPSYVNNEPWDKVESEYDDMRNITKQDVIDFTNKYFTNDYVIVYKHTGVDSTEEKVQKPDITLIEPNRAAVSDFAKRIMSEPVTEIQPVFLDYKKDLKVDTLPHHLPLYYVKNTENGLFNIFYVFEMGNNNDKKLSYALNYLQYLGMDKLSADQLSKRLYELGCSFAVQTGSDQAYVTLSGSDENMDLALQLFEELLNHCQPDDNALHKMLEEEMKNRADAKLNKNYIRTLLQEYAMYGSVNPSNNVLSSTELNALTGTDLVNELHSLEGYKHKVFYYGPRDIKTFEAVINKYHITPEKLRDYPPETKFTPFETTTNKIYFVNFNMVQAEIEWVRKACNWTPQLVPTIRMFNQYYGGDMSSVVFQFMREARALAYSTYSQFTVPGKESDPHFIISYAGTQADKLDSTINAMNWLLKILPESDQSFENSKMSIKNQIQTERIIRTGILFNYETAQLRGVDHDLRKDIYDNVSKMTFADIQNFFNTYYKGKSFTYCILGADKKISLSDLNKYGEVKQLDLNDIFGY
jgi:predicted Zn-dependent peptidase